MGDLYDVKVEGIGRVTGGVYKNVNLEGITKILDNIEANDIKAEGTLNVSGNIICENISCEGVGKFTGNIEAKEHISFEGVTKVLGNIQGKTISVEGVISNDGLLSADEVSMDLCRKCYLNEIGGERIKIKAKSYKGFFIKTKEKVCCKVIEGDDIYLENVSCDMVRGKNIVIGKDCSINNIEYSGNLDISNESKVVNTIRL